jgi:hypothetical protein
MPADGAQLITGNSLLKKMVEAMPEAISHRCAFDEFDNHLREDRLEEVKDWEIQYEAWVEKPTGSPCIFDTSEPCKFCFPIHRLPRLTTISCLNGPYQIATCQQGGCQKRIQHQCPSHTKHVHDAGPGPRTITVCVFYLLYFVSR